MYNISAVTGRPLADDGATTHQIRDLVANEVVVRQHNGVYQLSTSPETFESKCVPACAADPSVVVTGTAAGRLWGFHHVGVPGTPIVLVEHDRNPLASGVTIRRTNVLDDLHRVRRRRPGSGRRDHGWNSECSRHSNGQGFPNSFDSTR